MGFVGAVAWEMQIQEALELLSAGLQNGADLYRLNLKLTIGYIVIYQELWLDLQGDQTGQS